ncbi:MAG: thiamine pyrophosphate-binding protein [Lachnospiraceae bacterium]|nr:thiamine pyrophosphate-binding protein [Lachnospiraceae bacterium]
MKLAIGEVNVKVSEYLVNQLIKYDVTDTFGIPGGVILRFLDAMKMREPIITPHLMYHEQTAGFAACGYAQASGRLGAAYATRGPGITNMITCIAEAYQESLPVLFITAHGNRPDSNMRFENNQELNIVKMVSDITKYAADLDEIKDVVYVIEKACFEAVSGRKGPVLLDVSSALWNKDLNEEDMIQVRDVNRSLQGKAPIDYGSIIENIEDEVKKANRPVVLIGDGLRYSISKAALFEFANKMKLPVISSRGSQDLLGGNPYYYGYIGSHGIRYANFILSKADLVVSLGNRLAFPVKSESFSQVFRKAKLIRVDIDSQEFNRSISGSTEYAVDAGVVIKEILARGVQDAWNVKDDWIEVCNSLKAALSEYDISQPVDVLTDIISMTNGEATIVSDIGNNEFWASRAYERTGRVGTLLMSKAYGTLGVALGRAIGAYYANKKPVVCIMGDQGFQSNLQELQYISQWKLPIKIVVLNNYISGMILDHEKEMLGDRLVHVDHDSGYLSLAFTKVTSAYGISTTEDVNAFIQYGDGAILLETKINTDIRLTPNLPKGRPCQDMEPFINRGLYEELNAL